MTETPEYWGLIARFDPVRLVELYGALVNPAVVEADLFTGTAPAGRTTSSTVGTRPTAIVHYIQSINTLDATLGLAQGASAPEARDNFEMA